MGLTCFKREKDKKQRKKKDKSLSLACFQRNPFERCLDTNLQLYIMRVIIYHLIINYLYIWLYKRKRNILEIERGVKKRGEVEINSQRKRGRGRKEEKKEERERKRETDRWLISTTCNKQFNWLNILTMNTRHQRKVSLRSHEKEKVEGGSDSIKAKEDNKYDICTTNTRY